MAKPNSEREFQNFIKSTIKKSGGWYSQLHPGIGSDTGIPDLLTAVDACGILGTELKIGSVENNTMVWSSVVRPTQIAWHTNTTNHGWPSCVLIGIPIGKTWDVYAVYGSEAAKVKDGLVIGKDAHRIDPRFFLDDLNNFIDQYHNCYIE